MDKKSQQMEPEEKLIWWLIRSNDDRYWSGNDRPERPVSRAEIHMVLSRHGVSKKEVDRWLTKQRKAGYIEVIGRNSYGQTYYGVAEERLREADFLFASEMRKTQLLELYGTMGNYINNYWTHNARKEV